MISADTWKSVANGAVYVVQRKCGTLYTESPEEQGKAEGLALLRIFGSYQEAKLYRDTVEEYLGREMVVQALTLEELWWPLKSAPNVRVELSHMPDHEWPRTVETLWTPDRVVH